MTGDGWWIVRWRFWTGGAAVLALIWAVESVRKGEAMGPWPLVPLTAWAAVVALDRFTLARSRRRDGGPQEAGYPR